MRIEKAKEITGSLSKPSKMPGHAYGLPAKECKTGGKLQNVKGSTCYGCYALKGCYVFKVVQDAQYRRLAAIKDPRWVEAMALLINSKKPDVWVAIIEDYSPDIILEKLVHSARILRNMRSGGL